MKKLHTLLLLCIFNFCVSQNGEWEWLKGLNGTNQLGNYGTQGVSALSNNPGGRENPQYWKDLSGNYWMFGGYGYGASGGVGRLSDLWKFNSLTNEWTWMKGPTNIDQYGTYGTQGVAAPANNPGARADAVTWVDATGNLWMFAGFGWPAAGGIGHLNDLWRYNIATNEWTWMKGTNVIDQNGIYGTLGLAAVGNNPGGRWGGAGWADALGNLWTFGATGFAQAGSGFLNDVWRYNIATNQWTWMKGSNSANQTGTYGTQGVPAISNIPGARHVGNSWKDASGNFWFYAGYGYPGSGGTGLLNDLWRFNSATLEWTWIKGSNLIDQNGTYGTINVAAPTNMPGARRRPISWVDPSGLVWMLGGFGFPAAGGNGMLNDLWTYNQITNNWTWTKGSQLINQNGTYGTLGIPAPANISGGRGYAAGWVDYCGNLWLFGGQGYPGSGGTGFLNDMWKMNNIAAPPSPTNTTPGINQTICSGNTATLFATSSASVAWFATPTSSLTLGTGTAFVTSTLSAGNYTFYAEAQTCTPSISRTGITVTVNPTPTISVNSGSICAGQSFTLSPSGALTYTYQGGSAIVSPTSTSFYTVTGTSSLGCVSAFAAISTVTVYGLPTITVNSGSICAGNSFTLNPLGANTYTYAGGGPVVSPTINSSYTISGTDLNGCTSTVSAISNISVTAAPIITVNSSTTCSGASFTMVPGGAFTYTYSSGFAVVNPTISTSYSVTGTSTTGCTSTSPAISNLTVVALPIISVNSGSVCLGNSFTISPSGALTYTYSSGNAVVSPTSNSSYSVTGTNSVGCVNPNPVVCNVTVMPLPSVSVSASGTFLCVGESATLTAGGATSYSWSSGGTNPVEVVSPTVTTAFTVTGTDAIGCSNTAVISQSVDLCLGLSNQQTNRNNIQIYPNPNKGKLIVNNFYTNDLSLVLFDYTGRIVFEQEIILGKNEIILSEIVNGIYIGQLIWAGKPVKQQKLIIE